MRKIIYDLLMAQPIGKSKYHGGGEYIKSVFYYFARNYSKISDISVCFDTEKYLDDYLKEIITEHRIKVYDTKSVSDVENLLKKERFDVFFTGMAYDYGNVSFPNGLKTIGTVHGLRSLECYTDEYEKYYKQGKESIKACLRSIFRDSREKHLLKYFGRSIRNFDVVITDSYHSKYSIKSFFPKIDENNIKVIYVPEKPMIETTSDRTTNVDIKSKFILFIGMNRWEKNGYRAMMAVEEMYKKRLLSDYKVVFVGGLPDKIRKKAESKDNYIFLNYVSTSDLEELYKRCEIFVYPTLNEGFGLPPLEAMKYGKTCVVSAVCSIPELCGDAAYYINPRDLNEIQSRMIQALNNKKTIETIKAQYERIRVKRDNDLSLLCDLISGEIV